MEFAKPIRSLMFSSSNNFLALGGDEGVLYVLSVPSRSIVYNTIVSLPIQSIAFSRHDERLAVGSDDGVLSLLCPDSDWEPAGEIETSDSPILAQDWCSKHMAVGRLDGIVAIFDTEKALSNFFVPLAEYSHALPVRSVAFGASGRFLGTWAEVNAMNRKGIST
jgi:WD40 repeat protein